MRIAIIGSEGAQGKRYQSILALMGVKAECVDLANNHRLPSDTEGIIIATPTATHASLIKLYSGYQVPILCEKPICKNMEELASLINYVKREKVDLSMVFQYGWLATHHKAKKPSYYNYFRHGNDGLKWDCFQIIALARDTVDLKETSPIWTCGLNGVPLNIRDMDMAYVADVAYWLDGKRTLSLQSLYRLHEKVAKFKL